ncbi:hypothetical protein ERO13_D09G126600v2 [Gossypium hirsutum]|uniref:Uncharacterized protein isoform X1 n=2 Tax=Gossypium hirsutum TaxID=3635 RepID=A0A1U8HZK8_GOSHI|nr:uncharacterized protein LOC107891226 isoform X1 [Gossypium hirsutum]KAG4130170.1 hypothetical protein ERO13_D09G126600v2 [Gossypium hirsutum]
MMEESPFTDLPQNDVELTPDKVKDEKEGGPTFHCDLCDAELVYTIAQAFLPGLSTACVDNTTGDVFKSPGSVAAEIRKEMVEYLTQRSETFVAESVVLDAGLEVQASDHPYDIIAFLIDEFATTKRNLFSRVSEWLLSDKREDKIDDFSQEMEINGFWSIGKREAIVQTLLKNVDLKNEFHCDMKFYSADELAQHVPTCKYRSMTCQNEGCYAKYSISQMGNHDSVCLYKMIPCEQNCSASLMRRDMDRHCITVCPMKLVNCPFYSVGCKSAIPQCKIEEHRSSDFHSHLLYILQGIHKEASVEVLRKRVEQLLQKYSSKLANIRDLRSLTYKVKDLDAKLGPLKVCAINEVDVATKTAGKLQILEASDTNKVTEKGAETRVVGFEAKPQSLEVTPTNKDSIEAAKAEIKDSEAKLQSLGVKSLNKVSKEGLKTKATDVEAKPQSLENTITNKDSGVAPGTTVNHHEARPPSLEVTPKKVSEATIENSVKDVEGKVRLSKVSTGENW